MTRLVLLMAAFLIAGNSYGANLFAGQSKAEAMCSQCHGLKKSSADSPFPRIFERDFTYLQTALQQYRDKTRKSDIMNAVTGSLSDDDIDNIAAYYDNIHPSK
jgi:cytochrome c553